MPEEFASLVGPTSSLLFGMFTVFRSNDNTLLDVDLDRSISSTPSATAFNDNHKLLLPNLAGRSLSYR